MAHNLLQLAEMMISIAVLAAFAFLCTSAVAVMPKTWCVQPDVAVIDMTCNSLDYYIENRREYFTSNTRMVFLPGTHKLSGVLAIAGVNNFSLSCDRPLNKANIHCDGQHTSGLTFSRSTNIAIKNINFISCGVNISQHSESPFAALSFERVTVITIKNVNVLNSTGYGVYATHICDQIIIQHSAFRKSTGGNARLSFKDCPADTKTSLLIKSSDFLNGSTIANLTENEAGGLLVNCLCPEMTICLDNVTASNNEGGNLQLKMEDHNWDIIIANSTITGGNGIEGSGLYFTAKFSHLQDQHCDDISAPKSNGNSMTIADTVFGFNTASENGGGLLIELYDAEKQSEITLVNCSFRGNVVTGSNGHGAALKIIYNPIQQFYSRKLLAAYHVNIVQSQFCNNVIRPRASAVDFVNLEMAGIKDSIFINNEGTAIAMTSSNIILKGYILFENNTAAYGGALRFCDSSAMFLCNTTKVIFKNNHVYEMGGAIYAQESCLDLPKACFFQPNVEDNSLVTDLSTHYQINLVFTNNTARVAGDAIYGGEIDNCYTYAKIRNSNGNASHNFSTEVFNEMFSGYEQISSSPNKVNFCGASKYLNKGVPKPVIPGQTFNVSVVAVGQRSGITPAIITAELIQNGIITQGRPTPARECANLSLTLLTTLVGIDVEILLKVQRDSPSLHRQNTLFSLSVQPCPWGFKLDMDKGKCECFVFQNFNYQCDLASSSLSIKHHSHHLDWIGCESERDCTNESILFAHGCGKAEYCDGSPRNITANSVEKLCADNRTGILCGSCALGQSVVLGTGRCKSCPPSNKYLSLVVLYLGSGVVLVIILTKLRLTVNNGSLNGLIFYANFVHWNRKAFFPQFHNADILRLVIAWLNLDLGIEVCFYNGMTALHVIWLQIGYILYIVFLQVTIILLCRRYVIFTRFFGRNVTKVLSTLVTLLYAKTLITAASVFTYTNIKNGISHDHTLKVLSVDGNVRFGSSQHIPLLVVASFLALIPVIFMFSLLFIQLLMKISSWTCFKWVARFQPFFETFTGPCNFSYAFWPGYLFFIRTIFLFTQLHFYQFNSSRDYAFQAGLYGFLTIIVSFLGPKGVYKKWSLNMLEFSLILNLTIFSFIVRGQSTVTITSHISVAFAMLQFFAYHSRNYTRCKMIKNGITFCTTHFKALLAKRSQTRQQESPGAITHTDVSVSTCVPAEQAPLLPAQVMPPIIMYDKLREPLIED